MTGFSTDSGSITISNIERFEVVSPTTGALRSLTLDGTSGIDNFDTTNDVAQFVRIFANAGDDVVVAGNNGRHTIYAGAGEDIVTAGDGGSIIEGSTGADILTGGSGIDTLSYLNESADVSINLATNTASGGEATGDIISVSYTHLTLPTILLV